MVELGQDGGTKFDAIVSELQQCWKRFTNLQMQQVDQASSGTRKHTRKQISGIVQTKNEPKCGIHENALVAQYTRDASTIAQQADM